MKEVIKIAKQGGWKPNRQYRPSDWYIFTQMTDFWKGLSKGLELDKGWTLTYIVPAANRSQVRSGGVIYFHVPRHKVTRHYKPRTPQWKKIWREFGEHLIRGEELHSKYFDDLLRRSKERA